ncbi:MAG: ferritin family protein [archaeon]
MMQVFRCKICGDPYIGEAAPTHCPFCGAPKKYIILAKDYVEPIIKSMSEASRKNLEAAVKLEASNSAFYKCASTKALAKKDQIGYAMFKALSKVEAEHAITLAKALGAPRPEMGEESCSAEFPENVASAKQREARATKHYGEFLAAATEPRLKEIFGALIEVEKTHAELLNSI